MFVSFTRWATAGLRADSRNVPLQLKKVLAAMRSDPPRPYPHRDFLNCLDRNSIHRKRRVRTVKDNQNDATSDGFCFAVNIQHDADEVFLSILNLIQQQMEDRDLVGV